MDKSTNGIAEELLSRGVQRNVLAAVFAKLAYGDGAIASRRTDLAQAQADLNRRTPLLADRSINASLAADLIQPTVPPSPE